MRTKHVSSSVGKWEYFEIFGSFFYGHNKVENRKNNKEKKKKTVGITIVFIRIDSPVARHETFLCWVNFTVKYSFEGKFTK